MLHISLEFPLMEKIVTLLGVIPTTREIMGKRSWGSDVLVCLYHGLCRVTTIKEQKEIGECLLLLQSWSYDHFPILSPRLYENTVHFYPLNEYNWPHKHEVWIQMWDSHELCVINDIPDIELLYHYLQYMQWYLKRTRRYISPHETCSIGVASFF
ncbi:hypothetical protein Lal_00031365 [Lupinus albus]|nr:hypothetical protein Lal_00031365 [Lupinus albus]